MDTNQNLEKSLVMVGETESKNKGGDLMLSTGSSEVNIAKMVQEQGICNNGLAITAMFDIIRLNGMSIANRYFGNDNKQNNAISVL